MGKGTYQTFVYNLDVGDVDIYICVIPWHFLV